MEGVLPPLPWTAPRNILRVPYVARPVYRPSRGPFHSFPQLYGLSQTSNAADLIRSCETVSLLTSVFQSWLFFELISAFLGRDINWSDFVTEGYVDLYKERAYRWFEEWRAGLTSLSHSQKQLALESLTALIKQATLKSELFEDAVDYLGLNDETFDLVALSVKLLINLLSEILDDTFLVLGHQTSRSRVYRISSLASRLKSGIGRFMPEPWLLKIVPTDLRCSKRQEAVAKTSE